jgi:hypothetical protein
MAMLYPQYTRPCEHCGGYVAASPEEAVRRWTEATYQPLMKLAAALQETTLTSTPTPTAGLPTMAPSYGQWTGDWTQPWPTHHRHHHGYDCDCGCRDHRHHGPDCDCGCRDHCRHGPDCHCRCCVVNADLVVNARLGERRLVPVTIENNRRRDREIKLELSDFTSKGGSATSVTGSLLSPAEFTLAACEQREILIGIDVAGDTPEGEGDEQRLPDVDDCRVVYADLRIVGCDHRPVRIAVATLPRDCHSYPVDCACGCC